SGLHSDDQLDAGLDVLGAELVEDALEGLRILQEGGDVLEEDPLCREILDVPNLGPQLGHVHGELPPFRTGGGRTPARFRVARGVIIDRRSDTAPLPRRGRAPATSGPYRAV